MKAKTKTTKIKANSINIGITFEMDGGHKFVQTGVFPSPSCPTIKALLDLIVFSINEECGTDFSVKQSEKQTMKELGY